MKTLILTLLTLTPFTSHASPSISSPGAITGLAAYGSFRSLGAESIEGLTKQIEHLCVVKRKGTILTPVECTAFQDHLNYRLCSAVCSTGGNKFINFDGSTMPKVKE